MTRKRMAEPQLKSYQAVDDALLQMSDLSRAIELEKAACNELVDQIKEDCKQRIIRPMTVPFYTYQAQMTAQIAAVAALVAAITEKAASFPSCAVQVPVVGE